MAQAENSRLGFAKQATFETPITDDEAFKYMLFSRSSGGPSPINVPLPPEAGGGALLRNILKVGVNSGVQGEFIPRPETLGFMLMGMTGNVISTPNSDNDAVLTSTALDVGTQTINTGLVNPSEAAILTVTAAGGATGVVTITGTTVESGLADTEDVTLAANATYQTVKHFSLITQIDLPAGTGTVSVGWMDGSYTHVFTLGSDQFQAPYYTTRLSPGGLWGEVFTDGRFALSTISFRSPDFLRGAFSILGREVQRVTAEAVNTDWQPNDKVDGGPQFITPVSSIELPTGSKARALSGSLTMMSNIPLDQQYIVGQYYPEGLDIVNRAFALTLGIKVEDDDLYGKMMFDPAGGAEWVANVYKEADINLQFASTEDAAVIKPAGVTSTQRPYSLTIEANGQSGQDANVVWTAEPPALVAQRQIVMNVTGTFLASPDGGTPITLTLVNRRASY